MSRTLHEPQLLKLLTPVRRRLMAVRLVRRTAAGLLAGSCAGVLLLAATRFLPVEDAPIIAAALAALGIAAGAAASFRPRIDERAAAREMDRAGTNDAIVTALDLLHLDTPITRLQRADAEAEAARFAAGLGERIPWPRGREQRRYLLGLAAIWCAAAILLLLPNPMDERLAARAALSGEIGRIEQALDELEQSGGLTEQERKALTEPLNQLREQALRMEPDALRAEWEAAEREIARLAAELKQEQQALRALANEMQRTPELGELGQALERGDRRGVAEAAERLGSLIARLSPEQREALAERLRELAGKAPEAGEDALREALEGAADALGNGELEAASEAIGQAMEAALSAEELQALAEQAATALAAAGSRLGLDTAGTAGSGWNGIADADAAGDDEGTASPGGGQPGSEGTQTGSSDAGQGQTGGGSGQNGSSSGGSAGGGAEGTGSGSPAGGGSSGSATGSSGGSGAGSGSGSGSGLGRGQGSGTGGGAGLGSGGRTLVTTPRIYEGEGEVTTDGGPASGGAVTEGGSSPAVDGGVRSYEEVYASYEADARRALSAGTLPPSLKERVKNYFDEIQPDR
ncbi:MAG: hypothetical protein C6W55_11760 [Thermobacillus sp.]|uniref:Uncharacterized protein n=1 Tax=Thermobacillus composti (strain DSM 18247 / JCM 13945 / KWC4) TaxID=717605 RepID=L0EDD9_THECK|nr:MULTISPECIES: hypothetical protein [Thermobacillus]AGA57706.1 hypothetical protein Theco_1568 [Thermobacillus composti KWC4]REK54509.1 MAG: hypothetical protein C6W55_11760 [Thermobacillus sp.]